MTRNILRKDIKNGHQGQKQVRVDEEEGYYYVAHLKTLATDDKTGKYIVAKEGEDYVEFKENDREVKGKGYTAIDGKIKLKADVYEKNKIYEYYTKSGIKHITYYDLGGNELVKAKVDKNGQMTFDYDNRFKDLDREKLKTAIDDFKDKVKEVLNYDGFPSVDTFDDILSQLEYSLLLLKNYQKKEGEKENIIIDTTCTYIRGENNDINIDYIAEKLIESLENPEQIRICDFGYSIYENDNNIGGHDVQMSISKDRLIMMNTGGGGKYNEILLKKIEEAFIKKCKEKAEKTNDINEKEKYLEYKDKLEISEFKGVEQGKGNCVMASKLYAVTLLSDNRYNSKKLIKAISRLENIARIANERGGVDKLTYEELSRLKESDVELLNDFVTGINEDVKNNNSRIELRGECIRYNNLLNKIKNIDKRIKNQGKNFVYGIKPKAILTDEDKKNIKEVYDNTINKNINREIITKIKEKAEAEGVDANQKMQYYLTAIKLGDKESINKYFEALELKDNVESEIEILNNLLSGDLLKNKSKDNGEYIKNVIKKFEDKIKDLEKERIKTALGKKDFTELNEYFKKMNKILAKTTKDDKEQTEIDNFNNNFINNLITISIAITKKAQSPSSMSLKSLITDFFKEKLDDLAWNTLTGTPVIEHIDSLEPTESLFNVIMNDNDLMNKLINYKYDVTDGGKGILYTRDDGFCWNALNSSIANGDNLQVLENENIINNISKLFSYGEYFNKGEDIKKNFTKNLTSKIKHIDINSIKTFKEEEKKYNHIPYNVKIEKEINDKEKKSLSINLLTGAVANNNKALFDNLIEQIKKFDKEEAKLTSDDYYTMLKESIENGETVDLEIYQKLLENCKDLPDKEKKLEIICNTIIEKSKENETLIGAEKGKINVDLLTLLIKNEAKLDFSKLSNSQKEYLLKYFHENPDKYEELKKNVINNLLKNEYEIEKYSKSEGEKEIKYRTFYKNNDGKIEKIGIVNYEVMEKAATQTADADENGKNEEEEEESREEKKTYNIYKINYSPNGEKDIEYYKAKKDSVAVNIKLDKNNKIKEFNKKDDNITENDIENIIQNGSRDDFNLSNLMYFQLSEKFGDKKIDVINEIEENLNTIGFFFDEEKDNLDLKKSAVEIVNKLKDFEDFVAFVKNLNLLKSMLETEGKNISNIEKYNEVNAIVDNFKELYGESNGMLEAVSSIIKEKKEAIEKEKRKAEEERKANHNTKEVKSTISEEEKEQIQKQIKTNKENYREKYEENKKNKLNNKEITESINKKNEFNKKLLEEQEKENNDINNIYKASLELRESKVLLQKNIEKITKVEKEIEIKNEQEAKILVEDYNGSLSKQGSISNKDAAAMVNNIMEAQGKYDVLGDEEFQKMTIKPITINGKEYNGYGGIIDYYDNGEMKISFTKDGFIADQLKQMFPNNDAVKKVFENGEIVFNGVSKEDAIRFVSEFKINPINAYLNFCNNKNVPTITDNIDNNEIKKLLNVATDCRRIIGEIYDISENIEKSENPHKKLVKSIKEYATEILMNPNGDKYKEIINNKDIAIKEPVYVARQLLKVAKAVDESLNISEEDKRKQKNKELLEEINRNIGIGDDIVKKLVTCINTSHHLNLKRAGLDINARQEKDKADDEKQVDL